MNYYFIVLLVLRFMNLGIVLSKHGEPKDGKYSFWIALISLSIDVLLVYFAIKTGF